MCCGVRFGVFVLFGYSVVIVFLLLCRVLIYVIGFVMYFEDFGGVVFMLLK